ncbi:DUF1223 domain-containing protein [Acidicapsa acidisoli]|uniref:DUF1223 domain-containing protein n=1 Tax=Acidicapsa acidisoli TaxID=1615681 RepID=UPI0021DF7E08|nr:DUF1223 domain-containing protein [Acidicapsa acidisoli]
MRKIRFNSSGWLGLALVVVATVAAVGFSARQTAVAAASGTRQPVLVELFTSEGCSSCPPADALLAKLDATQSVPGAEVIVLSEHVTYWDHQGWRDPFSLESITQRQQEYAGRFGLDDVYTPQAVVDGAAQIVGSHERELDTAIARAAAAPKIPLSIADAQWDSGSVRFSVDGGDADSGKTLIAALALDSAQSSVLRGENSGRNLRHVAVVRVMQEMARGAVDGRTFTMKASAASQPGTTGAMRLVVFQIDRKNGHVLALAERTIGR